MVDTKSDNAFRLKLLKRVTNYDWLCLGGTTFMGRGVTLSNAGKGVWLVTFAGYPSLTFYTFADAVDAIYLRKLRDADPAYPKGVTV